MPITLDLATSANLNALQKTQSLLSRSSRRIATGLRVGAPADDAQAYFAARALEERAAQNQIAKNNIEQASLALESALTGLEGISRLLDNIDGILSSLSLAKDRASSEKLRDQYNQLLAQIDNLANSTAYQGVNLINNSVNALNVSFSGVYGQNDLSINAIRSDSAGFAMSTIAAGLFFQTVTTISSQNSRDSIASFASMASTASRAMVNATPLLLSQSSFDSLASVPSLSSLPSSASNATNLSIPSQSSRPSMSSVASMASRNSQAPINFASSAPPTSSTPSVQSAASMGSLQSLAGVVVPGVNQALVSGIAQTLTSAKSTITATQSMIGIINAVLLVRTEFSKNYIMVAQKQIAELTAAELNEETANLTALQTAQQYGIVALTVTSKARFNLLQLF